MGLPSRAEWNAAWADALAAVKQIPQLPLPTSCVTSSSISLIDCTEVSVAGTQGGPSSLTTKKKQVGNIKLVPRSVSNNTQELRTMLPSQVHSPSLVWSNHSNWNEDLSTPHIIPPSPLDGHQSQLWLGHLGIINSRVELPLVVPKMSSPDIYNREAFGIWEG